MKFINTVLLLIFLCAIQWSNSQENSNRDIEFITIDNDGNNIITIREMRSYYRGKLSKYGKMIDYKKIFYALDANENSILTLSEYLKGEDWLLAYKYFDRWQFKEDFVLLEQNQNQDEGKNKDNNKGRDKNAQMDLNTLRRNRFNVIDSNNNGALTLAETQNFYRGKFNLRTGEPINGIIEFFAFDSNNDKIITIEEFSKRPMWRIVYERVKGYRAQKDTTNSESLSEAYVNNQIKIFSEVDSNKDYKISYDELERFYNGKFDADGLPMNALFQFYGFDKNEDNFIELAEFAEKIDLKLARKRYIVEKTASN
ncbi:hypothetical protein [uncultured Winogradskyella sp.]|uniref:hypothetical protein n=1 Tax=uncultured Winogradskyella sp. TaxID=395353 RepID=UPI00261743BD|nr:hypothetical protein [uncultured Winogradskyella sp.]